MLKMVSEEAPHNSVQTVSRFKFNDLQPPFQVSVVLAALELLHTLSYLTLLHN